MRRPRRPFATLSCSRLRVQTPHKPLASCSKELDLYYVASFAEKAVEEISERELEQRLADALAVDNRLQSVTYPNLEALIKHAFLPDLVKTDANVSTNTPSMTPEEEELFAADLLSWNKANLAMAFALTTARHGPRCRPR